MFGRVKKDVLLNTEFMPPARAQYEESPNWRTTLPNAARGGQVARNCDRLDSPVQLTMIYVSALAASTSASRVKPTATSSASNGS
jgi:hypothetical protein